MADIILLRDGQLPVGTRIRYRDMGDGTHALVFSVVVEEGGATQYPEDSPSVSGDLGMMALAVRNDAGGSLVSANGDYAPLQVNAAGQLIIAGGAGGTSMADDAAFAPGTTQITPMGAMLDDVAPDSIDEGDAGVPRMSANRNLYVRIRDNAGNERGLSVDAGGRLGANVHDGAGAALTSTLVGADQALDVNIVAGAGAGGTSMVDDAPFTPAVTAITPIGAMLDDTAPDSVDEGDAGVVRMSANRNLHTTIRDAAGNERGLNVDANNRIGVTNVALAVVGGGAEAAAQRVTIANDSTGLVSVDDGGGALTVDQATHDSLQCNANIQVGDADVAVGNPVPIAGTAAEDAACAGNPVLLGGRYHASVVAADAVDDGDAVRLLTDSVGGVVRGHRTDAWNANDNYAAAQTDTVVKAAPGANLALYVTDILFSTDTAMNIFLEAAAAIITPKVYLAANGGWSAHFQTPIRWTTNTAITITSSAAGNHSVLILGYTAP